MEGQFRVIPMSFDSVHQTFDANYQCITQSVNQHLKKMYQPHSSSQDYFGGLGTEMLL